MLTHHEIPRVGHVGFCISFLMASIFGLTACSLLNPIGGNEPSIQKEGSGAAKIADTSPSSSGSWFGSLTHFLSGRKGPSDRAVVGVEFSLGAGNEERLIPGQSLPVEVVVTDRDGKKFSWANGELDESLVKVTTELAEFDVPTRMIKPVAEIEKIRSSPYVVSVQYGERTDLTVRKSFLADVAALLGPDPQDVADIQVQVKTQYPDLLIPGRSTNVHIAVRDKKGRVYILGEAIPRLAPERLKVSTQFMKWDGRAFTILPQEDLAVAPGASYEMIVEYVDRPDIRVLQTFVPDFAMLKGPAPQDVKSLMVSVNGKDDGKPVVPGSSLPLVIQVTDKLGRVFEIPPNGNGFNLPKGRVHITMENMALEPQSFTLKANDSYKDMIGKNFVLKVTYEGRSDLEVTKTQKPDLASALKGLYPKGPQLTFQGEAGRPGQDGHSGQVGKEGRGSSAKYGHGGAGTRGEDGHAARPGSEGKQGPTVRVTATEVYALDGETRIILFQVKTGQEKKGTYFALPWDAPAIHIVAAGGKGGDGGNGGQGGAGGQGGFGYNSGNGGDGGNAGNGATGGVGGQGGKILLSATTKEIFDHFILETPGGPSGAGGRGGEAGPGGKSGGATGAVIGAASDLAAGLMGALSGNRSYAMPTPAPTPEIGNAGDSGQEGYPGEPGRNGTAGQVLVKVDGQETLAELMKDIAPEVADRIIVSRK